MANQHVPVTGGCLCGAVRYKSTAPRSRATIAIALRARRTMAVSFRPWSSLRALPSPSPKANPNIIVPVPSHGGLLRGVRLSARVRL